MSRKSALGITYKRKSMICKFPVRVVKDESDLSVNIQVVCSQLVVSQSQMEVWRVEVKFFLSHDTSFPCRTVIHVIKKSEVRDERFSSVSSPKGRNKKKGGLKTKKTSTFHKVILNVGHSSIRTFRCSQVTVLKMHRCVRYDAESQGRLLVKQLWSPVVWKTSPGISFIKDKPPSMSWDGKILLSSTSIWHLFTHVDTRFFRNECLRFYS